MLWFLRTCGPPISISSSIPAYCAQGVNVPLSKPGLMIVGAEQLDEVEDEDE